MSEPYKGLLAGKDTVPHAVPPPVPASNSVRGRSVVTRMENDMCSVFLLSGGDNGIVEGQYQYADWKSYKEGIGLITALWLTGTPMERISETISILTA